MHPCGHRGARSRIRIYARMHAPDTGGCIFVVWESGDARGGWKKGAICRAMAGTPLRVGVPVGIRIYTPLSLSDTFFASRRIFFSVASSCLRAYDAASSPPTLSTNPPPLVRLVRPSAFVTQSHVREGFYFKYFRFRWRDSSMNETARSVTLKLQSGEPRELVLNMCLCRIIWNVLYT